MATQYPDTAPVKRLLLQQSVSRFLLLSLCICGVLAGFDLAGAESYSLTVQIVPLFEGAPCPLGSCTWTNAAGQSFSFSRLDFLLSDFALRKRDGSWLEKKNWQEYINMSESRSAFNVQDVPGGNYDRIRFHVGLRPELNHSDPAQYPANHPLNANLNGLHWTWASGYVFFAIEGHWWTQDLKKNGYSYHLGNDAMLMTVEAPVAMNVNSNLHLQMGIALEKVLSFTVTEETAATHSREGDGLALRLKENVERAFNMVASSPGNPVAEGTNAAPRKIHKAPTATPYRFTFSAQFPMPDLPQDNPLTEEGVELGRRLFSDTLLSKDNSQSCASCHQSAAAFSDSGKRFSLGVSGRQGVRNSMPIFNLAWKKSFFWDGRAPSLREQVLEPIQNPIEMHEKLDNVVAKLQKTTVYPGLFQKTFGAPEITAELVSLALEQFLFTQLSCGSKFDRALTGEVELTEEEKKGFQLFMTEYDPRTEQFGADCFHCHGGPFFTTHSFANNGLDIDLTDLGRFTVTSNAADKGKFSVPSLRNVAVTAPYMHDGRFKTLEEVIEHYSSGVKRSPNLDPNIAKHPNGGVPLSDSDKKALVAFLHSLTDERFLAGKGTNEVVRARE